MKNIIHDLAVVDEFVRLSSALSSVEGFLDPREGYLLCRLAAEGPGLGSIVEIGSYCGRSTVFLAAGSKSCRRERVVAVDHFRGSVEHQAGERFASSVLARDGTTFHRFKANLERTQLIDLVEPIQAASTEAAARWTGPIRLLYIDGDHSYESVRTDWDAWTPFIVPGGLVALHDVGNAEGVTRLFGEVTAQLQSYLPVAGIVSLRVLQKL